MTELLYPLIFLSVDFDAIALVYLIILMHVDCDDTVNVMVHFVHYIFSLIIFQIRKLLIIM